MRAIFTLAIILIATPSFACSCWLESTDAKRAQAAAIFEGVVVGKRAVLHHDPIGGYNVVNEYDFAPAKIWKGAVAPRLTVRGGVACAIEFSAGRRYVVFAVRDQKKLRTMSCGPSAAIEDYTKYGTVEEHLGTPLAQFTTLPALPGAIAAAWYVQRANFTVGLMLLASLTRESYPFPDDVRTASIGIAITGVMAALVLLIGAATNFQHRKRALVLFVLSIIVVVTTIATAGRVFLSDTPNSTYLRWQLPRFPPSS